MNKCNFNAETIEEIVEETIDSSKSEYKKIVPQGLTAKQKFDIWTDLVCKRIGKNCLESFNALSNEDINNSAELATLIIKSSNIYEGFLSISDLYDYVNNFDFGTLIRGAIEGKIQASVDPEAPSTTQSNVETVQSVYGRHADNELNLLFLDYAFRGMYLLRSRFENKFRKYIWEACFINRGSIGGQTGAVISQRQMNNNIKTLQESQFGILVKFLKDPTIKKYKGVEINGQMYKENRDGDLEPTYAFDLQKQNIHDYFNRFSTEEILELANTAENDPKSTDGKNAQQFIDAYNAFVLLSNFDSYLTILFGKDIEILPFTQQLYNGYMTYALANKSHTNRTTHAEADEIMVDNIINYIVKGGIETTPEYDSATGNVKENQFLSYSDFASVIADIKTMMSSPAASMTLRPEDIERFEGLSQETKQYVTKYKTLRRCIAAMKFDMENNLRYVMELLNNGEFWRNEQFLRMLQAYGYNVKEKKDKLFSIYRGIFSNEEDSLYRLDSNHDILYNFTQNAATIYKNAIVQYYTDRRGATKVRYLFDQEFDNLKIRLENNINGSHSSRLSAEAHNAVINKDNKNKIKYDIFGNTYKITVETDTESPKDAKITLLEKSLGDKEYKEKIKGTDIEKFCSQIIKDNNVINILKQFISNQICLDFENNNYLYEKYKGNQKDKDVLARLFSFANQIKANAILKDELQDKLSRKRTPDERISMISQYFQDDNRPELLGKNFSLITPKMVPEFIRIAYAVQSLKEMNMPSIVKSGDGSAYSPYSMSRLLGSLSEQVELQCTKPDSATRDSAFVKKPGFFMGVAKNLEKYSYAQKGKKTVKFNTAEFMYGGFLYQFISGLMDKSEGEGQSTNKKDIFGTGAIGILPTTNADKSEVNTAIFDLNQFKFEDGTTLYDILKNRDISIKNRNEVLFNIIYNEFGTQFQYVYKNILQDFTNNINGFFTVINKYIQSQKINIKQFDFDEDETHALSGFQSFKKWFSNNWTVLKEAGIYTHKQLFDKALLWYNTEDYGRVNPAELYDQVDCTFGKDGEIQFSDTIISLLYRFNEEYVESLNKKIKDKGLDPVDLSDFYTAGKFFNYKNRKTIWDLLSSNFTVDLSIAFAANSDKAIVQESKRNNPEIFDLKKHFDKINETDGKLWYDQNSGQMIIAKVYDSNGKTHDIKNYTDLYLFNNNITEKDFLKSNDYTVEMNPLLEQYNLIDYWLSTEYTHCSVGSIISHIPKGKTSAILKSEKILATEALRYLAQTKRNVSLTAAMEGYQLGQRRGITTRAKMALLQDIYATAYNNLGDVDKVKPFDGATFVIGMQVQWENDSLASARVGQTKKPYAHYYNERLMCAGNIKTAAFPLNNENMRASSVYKNMFRMATSLKWLNPDGSKWVGDITRTIENNAVDFSTRPIYKKINDTYYQVSLEKADGENQYYVHLQSVDEYGKKFGKEEISGPITIDNNYTLWQIFGGENSYSRTPYGKLVLSERSIEMVADMANDIGVVKNTLNNGDNELDFVKIQTADGVKYFYQVLKQANIHYMPTEGAVKMFQCNMNPNTVYNDQNAKLNWSYFLTTQFGIQLDKEHNADEAELAMMTQVMNACAFRGFTFDVAQNLYKALYSLNKIGTRDFIVPFEKMLDPNATQEQIEAAITEFYSAINKSLIKTLATRAGKTDRAKLYAQKILDQERHGEEINYAELNIPFSAKSIYRQAVSSIASILTKQGIKHKISGTLSVLTPSYNCVLVYGNGKLKTDFSDFDSEIKALQNAYDQDPAFDLERNTDVDIKQIILSASNDDGEHIDVDGTRYSIKGKNGYIDLTYNFWTKEYDITFNIDAKELNELTEDQITDLFSAITNAVPIGKSIRFANNENKKISKDNLEIYEKFREFGFVDVLGGNNEYDVSDDLTSDQNFVDSHEFTADKSKIIIPTMERNILQKQSEETPEKTDSEIYEEHFSFLNYGRRLQIYKELWNKSNQVFIFTKDQNQKDILALKEFEQKENKKEQNSEPKNTKIHIIEISDTKLGNQDFINETIKKIKETNPANAKNICIIGDDITKFKSKYIQQADFNRTFNSIIQEISLGVGNHKIKILSDGQSGVGYAAIMSAKNLNQDWSVVNGGKCIFKQRKFVFDDRPASERWTREAPTQDEYFDIQTSFGLILPDVATFKPGTYLPDAIFQKLQKVYEKKQKDATNSFNNRYKKYIDEYEAFKVEKNKWEEDFATWKKEHEEWQIKYNEWEEKNKNKRGRKPKAPEEPKAPEKPEFKKQKPKWYGITKNALQDISRKTIQNIIDDYQKATDKYLDDYEEDDYDSFLKPLYELWAYQNPKLILAYKKKMAEDTSRKIYDGAQENRNLARILSELLENVSWAYKFETANLEDAFSKNYTQQKEIEQLNVMAKLANKYIGYLPSNETEEKNYLSEKSVVMALAQDPEVVNCQKYQKGDITLICTLNPNTEEKKNINKKLIGNGQDALKDGAVLLIGNDDKSLDKNGELKTEEQIKNNFGSDVVIVPIRFAEQKFFAISKSQEAINATFIKQEFKIANQTFEYYVPSSLFLMLQQANKKILLSTHSSEEVFDLAAICSAIHEGKFDTSNWDMSQNGIDPILYSVQVDPEHTAYCFGRKESIKKANKLYDLLNLLDNITRNPKDISEYEYKFEDASISENLKSKFKVVADTKQDLKERKKNYTEAHNTISDIIDDIKGITYLGGPNSILSRIDITKSSTRAKRTFIDPEVSMMYVDIQEGQENFSSKFDDNFELNPSDNNLSDSIISNGFQLNEKQSEAVRQSIELITKNLGDSSTGVSTIVINGKAGTGKTSTVDAILRNLPIRMTSNSNLIVGALSHKAKNIIDSDLSESIKHGRYSNYQSLSFAQMLGIKPNENGVFDYKHVGKFAPIKNADIVVLDEISMLNTSQIEIIKSVMKKGSILLLLGDKGQLPALEEDITNNFVLFDSDKRDPYMFLSPEVDEKVVQLHFDLEQNMRQGTNDNPILNYAEKFYDNVPESISSNITNENESGAIYSSTLELTNPIVKFIQESVKAGNLNAIKILAYTNNAVNDFNNRIHRFLGHNNPQYELGEFVIMKQNTQFVENSMEGKITTAEGPEKNNVQIGGKDVKFHTQQIDVKLTNGQTVTLKVIPELQFDPKFIQKNPGIKDWMRKNGITDIGLSYATTVHKAQGSTYDVVLIQYDDIMNNKNIDGDVKSKLMYTALTRARNIAVIMSNDNSKLIKNIKEKNDHFVESKRPVFVSRTYNVKGLESFEQKEDGTLIATFNFRDSNDRFDFRKDDFLYDANHIEYRIIEDPVIFSLGNQDSIEEKFGSEIKANPGDVVVKVKPIIDNKNIAETFQTKLQDYQKETGIDFLQDSKLKKTDTSRIRIGKTYKIYPNLWTYNKSVTKYNNFDIIKFNTAKDAIKIDGKQIILNPKKLEELSSGTGYTFDEFVEMEIYKAVQMHFNKEMTPEQAEEKAKQIFDKARRPEVRKLESAEDYIDVTDQINEGKISKAIEIADAPHELSSINYTFEDTAGNKYQLMDIDSIRNLFKLKSIIKKYKLKDYTAYDDLRSFGINTVGIDYDKISDDEKFKRVVKEIDSKLRVESQYDLNNLSQNTADLLLEFDKLCEEFDYTHKYCERVRDWVNYVLGRTGERKLTINGKTIEITPEQFNTQKVILKQLIRNRTCVKINGQEVKVDKSTVECEPYEVVMPKVMATIYGLKAGDSVSNILNSYESKTFVENETPANNIEYLGFFGKRLMDNWYGVLQTNKYDLCLKNITGEHFYIISKANAKKLQGVRPISPRTTIDINGNRILLNEDGSELFEIGKDDEIIVDNSYGQKIVVTDNPELYLKNIKYSYITFGSNLDEDGKNTYVDHCISVYNEGMNEQLVQIIDELKEDESIKNKLENDDKDELIKNVFKNYIIKFSNSPTTLLERFRKEGLRIYASFKTTLDIIASRIPAQCQHSFMPMRIVGFVDSDVNNAFVSTDQIWLQGSDYDIDTVSLATYSVDKGGKLYLWSPYAKYNTYEEIQQSRKIPVPTSVEYKLRENEKDISNDDVEYLDSVGIDEALAYFNQFAKFFKPSKKALFELDRKSDIKNIIAILNSIPKLINPSTNRTANLRDTLKEFGFLDSDAQISNDTLIKKYNNSLLDIFNKHNLYLRKIKSPHVQKQIANNITISSMIEVSKDPANMIESRTPIDSCKDEWNKIAETSKKNDIEYRQPGSVTLKANGIVENQVGKDCISIAAVGLKALSAIQYYYNKILNSKDDPRQNDLYFDITIAGKRYTMPADVRPKSPNTLNDLMLRKLLDAVEQNDPALAVSALLSLSVDNAKDLSLNKLNANPATLGMYIFGVTIGVPVDTLTDIIMGPIGDLAIQILQTNSFTDFTDSFNTLYNVFSYLEKGPWNYLKRKYNYKNINGERAKKTVYQELCSLAKGEDKLKQIIMSGKSTIEDKITSLNQLKNKYLQAIKNAGHSDFSTKVCYAIDELITYVVQADVVNTHKEQFKDFRKLFDGAQEMKALGQILSLNQGLKNDETQSDRMLIALEEMVGVNNAIDLEQIVFKKKIRDEKIKEFEKRKVAFNSLAIIFEKEDVRGFLNSLTVSTRASLRSAKYTFGLDNYKKVKNQLKLLYTPDVEIIKGLRKFYDDFILDEFLASRNLKFKVLEGGTFFDKDGNPRQAEGDIELILGTDTNNATFRAWVEQDVIPFLKEKYSSNKFVSSLGVVSSNKTISHNEELYYSIPTINLSPREKMDQYIFDKYVNEYMKLSTISYGGIPIHDIFAYYNIIAQRRNLGENTFTKLIDVSNSKVIKELEDFIAAADDRRDRYTVGYNNSDIKVEDVLPYVVPIYSAKTANSGYVRMRNPFTREWTILRNKDAFVKKGQNYYDEDEDYEIMYDFDLEEDMRRATWYDDNFEEIKSKVDTQYFRTGKIHKSSHVNFKDLVITYSQDQDDNGYHKIYYVRKRNDIVQAKQRFEYGAVKIIYNDKGEREVSFDKKKINLQTPDLETLDRDFAVSINLNDFKDNRGLIELGERPDDEVVKQKDDKTQEDDGKQKYYPRISVQFKEGKLSSFEIEFTDGVYKAQEKDLKGKKNPIIINGDTATIKRETLIKVIKAIEKNKQNGC